MVSERHAIADRIDREHKDIRRSIGQLELNILQRFSEKTFPDWRLTMILDMRDFQSQLLKHFDVEEEGGFLQSVLSALPHAEYQVHALRDEHQEMIMRLNRILDKLRSMQAPSAEIQQELHQDLHGLLRELIQHEEQEHILLQETFYRDIGGPA